MSSFYKISHGLTKFIRLTKCSIRISKNKFTESVIRERRLAVTNGLDKFIDKLDVYF